MQKQCQKCGHVNEAASGDVLEACPACSAIYSKVERAAESRAMEVEERSVSVARPRSSAADGDGAADGFSQRQWVAFVGAAVLAVGVFAPLISGPMGISINYFANGKGQGVFVLAMAACSLGLARARRYPLLWATGGLSATAVAYSFWRIQTGMAKAKETMTSSLQGNPFRGLAEMAAESFQMQWGWAVLAIGAVLVLVSAGMKRG